MPEPAITTIASLKADSPASLMVSRATNPRKLAGAISHQVRGAGRCSTVVAMGPEAVHKALQALSYASSYLKDDSTESQFAVTAEHSELPTANQQIGERNQGLHETHLRAWLEPCKPKITKELKVPITKETNTGKTGAFVAHAMQEDNGHPALEAVGPKAVSQALKSLMVAQHFVQKSHAGKFVFTPRFERRKLLNTQDEASKAQVILMTCWMTAPTKKT